MPRHHFNQLRFALENRDKSRFKCRLLPIYYFFEFRYDDKTKKAVPKLAEKNPSSGPSFVYLPFRP
jgi:hypothetical protein